MDYTSFRVISHTGGDDKDNGNTWVASLLTAANRVVFYFEIGRGNVYRNGDDNDYTIGGALSSDEISGSKLVCGMTGDDGDWEAAFSMIGFDGSGQGHQLLSRTGTNQFKSGHNDHMDYPLTATSMKTSKDTIAIIEEHNKKQGNPKP